MPTTNLPAPPHAQIPTSRVVAVIALAGAVAWSHPSCAAPAAPPAARPATVPKKPAAPLATKPKPVTTAKPAKPTAPKQDASIGFFGTGMVPRLKIQIPEPELQRLRQQPREYVRCTVVENDKTRYEHVGIHLKGAAGSFRGIDDRPALTLNFDKYKKGQEFHDLDKIHLNNSVQDPGYLNELISSELFLAAGIPAARATHARVWLNGRDLGFYVLKEGFDKGFLKRHGLNPDGNLYEGGLGRDIENQPKLQSGSGPVDQSDVKALVAACREPDNAKRWQRLEELVDIDRFLTFMALELMTCHWDGYSNARNNYRFYFDPKSGKVQFFPHGMDQMFADPNYSVLNRPGAMVAAAVMSNPVWRGRYRDRLSELLPRFVPADRLQKRLNEQHQRLRPVLAEIGAPQAADFDARVKAFKDRLSARAQSLTQQNAVAETLPLRFTAAGVAPLLRWTPHPETPDSHHTIIETSQGKTEIRSLTITAGLSGRCVGSWRTKVLLPAGKYRFEARVSTQGVKPLADPSGPGAGLRAAGGSRTQKLEGTSGWTVLSHEFQIQAAIQEVELLAELRATAGQASFDASSMRLVKVSK